jgi:hypothetical protein
VKLKFFQLISLSSLIVINPLFGLQKPNSSSYKSKNQQIIKKQVVQRDFQFNLYAKKVYFSNNRIFFEGLEPKLIVFEVKTPNRPQNIPYISTAVNTSKFFQLWDKLFPINNAEPNAFINGWDEDKRKLLTLTLFNPYFETNNVSFDYRLDKFSGKLNIDDLIEKWEGSKPLFNLSLLIDGVTTQQQWINPNIGSQFAPNPSSIRNTAEGYGIFGGVLGALFL